MLKSKNILLLFLVSLIVMACENITRPAGVLSAGDFEDVLYDIHMSHYLEFDKPVGDTLSYEAHRYALTLDVLKKHDVTQAEWDSSMVYYTRHSPQLKEIYDNLYERLSLVAESSGASVGDGSTDSTDIWKSDRQLLLTSQRSNCTMQWTIKTDTLLKAGDKLCLEYLLLFLNKQTQNRLMTVLTIRLNNDSVIVRNQVSSQTGIYSMNIEDDKKIGIKSVSGYFMLMHPQTAMLGNVEDAKQINNTQIVEVTNIKLTHQSIAAPLPEKNDAEKDSTTEQQGNQPDGPDHQIPRLNAPPLKDDAESSAPPSHL